VQVAMTSVAGISGPAVPRPGGLTESSASSKRPYNYEIVVIRYQQSRSLAAVGLHAEYR